MRQPLALFAFLHELEGESHGRYQILEGVVLISPDFPEPDLLDNSFFILKEILTKYLILMQQRIILLPALDIDKFVLPELVVRELPGRGHDGEQVQADEVEVLAEVEAVNGVLQLVLVLGLVLPHHELPEVVEPGVPAERQEHDALGLEGHVGQVQEGVPHRHPPEKLLDFGVLAVAAVEGVDLLAQGGGVHLELEIVDRHWRGRLLGTHVGLGLALGRDVLGPAVAGQLAEDLVGLDLELVDPAPDLAERVHD